MSITLSYLVVIVIWSTTPLTVQWSGVSSPLYALAIRMLIGVAGCWVLAYFMRVRVPFNKRQVPVYLVTGLSMFAAMTLVYLSAQRIPSGWISVLFGLSPITTGICARIFLRERSLSWNKVLGMCLGFAGLVFVFASGFDVSADAVWGIIMILFAVMVSGLSAVWIKRLNQTANLTGLQTNIGGLTVAIPFYIVSWLCLSDEWFPVLSSKEISSIAYLGLVGTTLGFSLYYYLLKNMEATRVALIALITPISCLLLGSWLNNEPVLLNVWVGAALICSGLISFELQARKSWFGLKKYRQDL